MVTEVARTKRQDPIPLAIIIAQAAHHVGVPETEIRHSKRGRGPRNLARAVAMKLGQERGGATLTELAQVFNVGHYSTISQTIARFNRHIRHDEEAAAAYNMLSQDLTP